MAECLTAARPLSIDIRVGLNPDQPTRIFIPPAYVRIERDDSDPIAAGTTVRSSGDQRCRDAQQGALEYDDEFLLVCRPELTIAPEQCDGIRLIVAERS